MHHTIKHPLGLPHLITLLLAIFLRAVAVASFSVKFPGLLLYCLILLQACASSSTSPLLNSERIEQQFGSYGVEVLCADDVTRVSNLYSLEPAGPVTRTIALVEFMNAGSSELLTEHQTIVAGGSIGKTLTSAGWVVSKHSHQVGTLDATALWPSVAPYMKLAEPVGLAIDRYVLAVSQGSRSMDYARILEIYHPDYLGREKLMDIVSPVELVSQVGLEQSDALNIVVGCLR